MEKDFKIELPEGVKITDIQSTLSENGNVATITVCMKEEYIPKNGDFVRIEGNYQEFIAIYNVSKESDIYKKQNKLFYYVSLSKRDKELMINDWMFSREVFPATTDEIRKLEEALAEKGKKWNPDKKCIEDLPNWRADIDEVYFYISSACNIIAEKECHCYIDGERYKIGNYFKTEEAAEKVAEKIRDIFKNSNTELLWKER